MDLITLYYSIRFYDDGSAGVHFFGSQETAEKDQELLEGWGEDCTGNIDSYRGSAQDKEATINDEQQALRLSFRKNMTVMYEGQMLKISTIHNDGLILCDADGKNFHYTDFTEVLTCVGS